MNNNDEDDDNNSIESSDVNESENNELTNDFNQMSQINTSINDLEINWNKSVKKMTFNNIETPILQSYNDLEKQDSSNIRERIYNLNNLDSTEFRYDDDEIEREREEEEQFKLDDIDDEENNSSHHNNSLINCNSNEMNIIDKIVDDDYIDEDFEISNKNSEFNIDDDNDSYTNNNINNNQTSDIRCDDDINSNTIKNDNNDGDDVNQNNDDEIYNKNKEFIIDDDDDDIVNINNQESKLINREDSNINKIEKQFQLEFQHHQQKPKMLKFESLSSIEDNNTQQYLYEDARIWSDTEALLNQIPQTEASSCGKIAIINVFKALNYEFDYDYLNENIKYNKRNESGTLAQYLFSRSIAGMNANELIENIRNVSNNKITGRFFSFYPPRDANILQWLSHWIKKGAIPVALLNLQRVSIWGFVPDAWHHQMIYGCGGTDSCINLTNPIERKTVDLIMKELTSESVLLVRSIDIIKRYNPDNSNLIELIKHSDTRWQNMNVLGQIVNVLREYKVNNDTTYSNNNFSNNRSTSNGGCNATSNLITHIEIPASYVPGISLFAYSDSPLWREIFEANELPIK